MWEAQKEVSGKTLYAAPTFPESLPVFNFPPLFESTGSRTLYRCRSSARRPRGRWRREGLLGEGLSSRKEDRPELAKVLDYCREDDVLVVYKLDRLGRSLRELLEIVNGLQERGVGFRSLQESLDTTTPGGRLVFHIFASLAEFERDLIRERTMAGLQAARARGRSVGRKPKMDARKVTLARKLMADPNYSVAEICRTLGVSSSTLYRHAPGGASSSKTRLKEADT
jgi:DNA invertase Pin-like site-specific DNA recombinase